MADRSNSERLRGFCDRRTDRQTDVQTDICDSRVAFATENIFGNKRRFTLHLCRYLKNYEECCRQLARHKFSFFLILLWSLRDLNCYCEWLNLQKYDLFQNVNLIIITASYLLWPLDHLFWKNSKLNCHWPHKYVQFSSSWPHVFWIYREYLCEVWCCKYAPFIIAKLGREGDQSRNIF